MAIVCPTCLSEPSLRAGTLAATIAQRLGEPLLLLGVVDEDHPAPEAPPSLAAARARLEAEAERLRASGVTVEARLESGRLEDVLAADEALRHARMMVLAAEGWPPHSPLKRASVPERVARLTEAPVLVVRKDEALLDWARGRRRLLVVAGVDLEPSSEAAVAFLSELRRVGPCDVLATYVCIPAEERQRLGIHSPVHVELLDPVVRGLEALDPQVEGVLRRELSGRLGPLPGEGAVEVVLEPGYGRPADHLLHVAHARGADLVVVGTQHRTGLQRLLHGSVSSGVLRHAEQSVACVPPSVVEPRRAHPPKSVLVPVDFSEASARAIEQARSLVGPGGRVHLLHVHRRKVTETHWDWYGVLPEPPREQAEVLRRLRALVPREEEAGAVQWTVEGVSGDDVARAICQATEREGVDLVCLGVPDEAHRHRGLDAVTRELMARCRRPVMVVPAH